MRPFPTGIGLRISLPLNSLAYSSSWKTHYSMQKGTAAFCSPLISPFRVRSCNGLRQLRRARHILGCLRSIRAQAYSGDVQIREATGRDVGAITKVMVGVFCGDDEIMQGIRESSILGKLGMGGVVGTLYQVVSEWEVKDQLSRRLGQTSRQENIKEAFAKRHVVLVAVDGKDQIIGCIEMGLVNVPRLLTEGLLNEVKQWEENVVRAGIEAEAERLGKGSSGQNGSEDLGLELAPYIGNLAVASDYRRKGVGSVLVRAAQRHALERWKKESVCLHVEVVNRGACMLYASLGFSCELQEPKWYEGIGRARRLFLRASGSLKGKQEKEEVMDIVKSWDKARVVGRKMNFVEYIRYCVWDLRQEGKRRQQNER